MWFQHSACAGEQFQRGFANVAALAACDAIPWPTESRPPRSNLRNLRRQPAQRLINSICLTSVADTTEIFRSVGSGRRIGFQLQLHCHRLNTAPCYGQPRDSVQRGWCVRAEMASDRHCNGGVRGPIQSLRSHRFGDFPTHDIVPLNRIGRNSQPRDFTVDLIDDKRSGQSSRHTGHTSQGRRNQSGCATFREYQHIASLFQRKEKLRCEAVKVLL